MWSQLHCALHQVPVLELLQISEQNGCLYFDSHGVCNPFLSGAFHFTNKMQISAGSLVKLSLISDESLCNRKCPNWSALIAPLVTWPDINYIISGTAGRFNQCLRAGQTKSSHSFFSSNLLYKSILVIPYNVWSWTSTWPLPFSCNLCPQSEREESEKACIFTFLSFARSWNWQLIYFWMVWGTVRGWKSGSRDTFKWWWKRHLILIIERQYQNDFRRTLLAHCWQGWPIGICLSSFCR